MNPSIHSQAISTSNSLSRFHKAWRSFDSLHHDLSVSLFFVILSRLWLGLVGAFIILTRGATLKPDPRLYQGLARVPDEGLGLFLAPWQRWDALWYLRIAELGYRPDDPSTSFFPLFPILIRVTAPFLGQSYLLAALALTTIATLCAFVLLYRLAAELIDRPSAERAVIALAVFPTAFYLFGAYAEAVLLMCALASVYEARRKRWWLSGIAAAGATLARPIGFLILIPLAMEAWRPSRSLRQRVRALLPLSIAVGALGIWMLYLQIQFQDPLLWTHSEASWGRSFVIPGQTVIWAIQVALSGGPSAGTNLMDLVLTLLVLTAILTSLRKLPLALSVYALAMVIVPLASYAQALFWPSLPMAAAGRRALVIFPAFIIMASSWRRRMTFPLWVLLSTTVETLLFAQFVMWTWVD